MPYATFVFTGMDNENIYFNVCARLGEVTSQEVKDIKQKTMFLCITESSNGIYKGEFSMNISNF